MNAREMYNAIEHGSREDQQQVLFELCGYMQIVSTAILEMAGGEKLRTGRDPLSDRSRLNLSEFIELKERRR